MAQEQRLAEERALRQKQEWEERVETLKQQMEVAEQKRSTSESPDEIAEQQVQMAEELAKAEIEYEERQKSMMLKQQELEENLKKQVKETKILVARKQREREERSRLDLQLLEHIPMVNEANSISEELQKGTGFVLKLVPTKPKLSVLQNDQADSVDIAQSMTCQLKVQVSLPENGFIRTTFWDVDKFDSRLYAMREMYQIYVEHDRSLDAVKWELAHDPFMDAPEPQLIGWSFLYLESLVHGLDMKETIPVMSVQGQNAGSMRVEVAIVSPRKLKEVPSQPSGVTSDNVLLHHLDEFMEETLELKVTVASLENLPGKLCKDVFLAFRYVHQSDSLLIKQLA